VTSLPLLCAAAAAPQILPEFFKHFWVRRMALDRRNYRALVETTVEIAGKVGCSEIVGRVVEDLKDESEPYRCLLLACLLADELGGLLVYVLYALNCSTVP
jgi:hypothetical protein